MPSVGRVVKERMVEELATRVGESHVLVTSVSRLSAAEADALRQKLRSSRARLIMMKRRLGLRTLERLNLAALGSLLEGTVGFVVTAGEATPIAKELIDFSKAHENQLQVRGGWVDGQLLDSTQVEALAQLPPKPMLLADVIATLESPLAGLIFTIEQVVGDMIWVVEQRAGQAPAQAAAMAAAPISPEPPPPAATSQSRGAGEQAAANEPPTPASGASPAQEGPAAPTTETQTPQEGTQA